MSETDPLQPFQENGERPRISRPAIVALAPNTWSQRWMNRQQLLSRLAGRGWPVTYSTGALSLWNRSGPEWAAAPWLPHCETQDGVLVDRPGKALARWPRWPAWDRFAARGHAGRLIAASGGGRQPRVAYLFHPKFWPYVEHLKPRHVVYHAYDAFSLLPDWTPRLAEMEERLIDRADLVVATAQGMVRHLADRAPGIRVLPNGADAEAFADGPAQPCPADLAAIPHPRIGYVGALNRKVDLPLVLEIAKARPDWHWVLVGPANPAELEAPSGDPHARAAWSGLKAQANVHRLGPKPTGAMPAYVGHMDVNTICYQLRGGWGLEAYPLKLHEYLAAGKPVVGADTVTIREFSAVVGIARTVDEWIAAIGQALTSGGAGTAEARRRVAAANTWDARVDLLESWLTEMVADAGGASS